MNKISFSLHLGDREGRSWNRRDESDDGISFRTTIPGRDHAKRKKQECEMGIVVNDRDKTSRISKQTPSPKEQRMGKKRTNDRRPHECASSRPIDARAGVFFSLP